MIIGKTHPQNDLLWYVKPYTYTYFNKTLQTQYIQTQIFCFCSYYIGQPVLAGTPN